MVQLDLVSDGGPRDFLRSRLYDVLERPSGAGFNNSALFDLMFKYIKHPHRSMF